MRKSLIAGNFKMHKTLAEARAYAKEIVEKLPSLPSDKEVVLCPSFTALEAMAGQMKGSAIQLGAQNAHHADSGAFTGEVSILMLKEIGCTYVIIGHSERRHILKESDAFINSKVKAALSHNMRVILCVGELLEDRETGLANTVVKNQIENGLFGIDKESIKNLIIAYEPVWAIGTGKTATPKDAENMHLFIRKTFATLYGEDAAANLIIQYGGSVKPSSIDALMAMDNIDGVLVGGACLDVSSFLEIINFNS